MSSLLVIAPAGPPADASAVLASLALLPHACRVVAAEPAALLSQPAYDAVVVDGRRDLAGARNLVKLLRVTGVGTPVLLVAAEGGLVAVNADWGVDDVILDGAGPAETDARLRLIIGRAAAATRSDDRGLVRAGDLVIDEEAYTARLGGGPLDLTFKEFELLKYLAAHPGRVFSREQLLQEVWGYDYYGGTRTVDVHIRRLRAKLGSEHENMIGTVRNVGYKFVSAVTPLPSRTDGNPALLTRPAEPDVAGQAGGPAGAAPLYRA